MVKDPRTKFDYAAFISYSHEDEGVARWLHAALERYRIPTMLGIFNLTGTPNRIFPVYRDRDEARSGPDLGAQIRDALDKSHALIVICSPLAAKSMWVELEISYFQSLGRGTRIFTLLAPSGGRSSAAANDPALSFPASLRVSVGQEPLAADMVRDGRHRALLKIIAGLLDVNLGKVIDRDRRARLQRQVSTAIALTASTAAVTVLLGVVGENARRERIASRIENFTSPYEHGRYVFAAAPPPGALLAGTNGTIKREELKILNRAALGSRLNHIQ
jgi:hypothetical protein